MINKKIGVLLLFALLISFGAKAQRATSMRINEVLVINEDNFVDDYGKRHGWIELFNTSAGTVNIAGCYLTDDKNNPMKYPIPKGDVLTQIQPRQHTLFWADGQPGRWFYLCSDRRFFSGFYCNCSSDGNPFSDLKLLFYAYLSFYRIYHTRLS